MLVRESVLELSVVRQHLDMFLHSRYPSSVETLPVLFRPLVLRIVQSDGLHPVNHVAVQSGPLQHVVRLLQRYSCPIVDEPVLDGLFSQLIHRFVTILVILLYVLNVHMHCHFEHIADIFVNIPRFLDILVAAIDLSVLVFLLVFSQRVVTGLDGQSVVHQVGVEVPVEYNADVGSSDEQNVVFSR